MGFELFRSLGLPVLQNRTFPNATAARASAIGDLVLTQDERTGLVSNTAFLPSLLAYDNDYQNEQAHSPTFRRHLGAVCGIIERHFAGQRLIEVGCGKGYFLEYLRSLGYDIQGIDPAYEGDAPYVTKAPFARGSRLGADAVVLRHVLEHMQDPLGFLADLADATGGRGVIYLEVPCFDWILRRRAWFDVFYEHVNYFRAVDFERLFGTVFEYGHVFGGQYLYVVASLASLRTPLRPHSDRVALPADFLAGVERATSTIRREPARSNVVWGASSKGVIFSVYMSRAGNFLDAVIDINPAKQGRFLAVSGLQVASPDVAGRRLQDGDNVFVMNSNYLDEIVAESRHRYSYVLVDHE